MKTFIIKVVLFVTIVIILPLSFITVISCSDKEESTYDYKLKLVDTVPSPRIIIIGGSNVFMGLNSQLIEESLGYRVVNVATISRVGFKFMIDDIACYAREGDILLFFPEYGTFYGKLAYGKMMYMIYKHPEKWYLLNLEQWTILFRQLPVAILQMLKDKPDKYTVRENVNSYGDFVKHWDLPGDSTIVDNPISGDFNKNFAKYTVEKFNELSEKCEVYFMPPFCADYYFEANKEKIDLIGEYFVSQGYPYFVNPEEHAFPKKYIYDYMYHPTYSGVLMNTEHLIEELTPLLKGAQEREAGDEDARRPLEPSSHGNKK